MRTSRLLVSYMPLASEIFCHKKCANTAPNRSQTQHRKLGLSCSHAVRQPEPALRLKRPPRLVKLPPSHRAPGHRFTPPTLHDRRSSMAYPGHSADDLQEDEDEARAWIEAVTQLQKPDDESFEAWLRSGVVLVHVAQRPETGLHQKNLDVEHAFQADGAN